MADEKLLQKINNDGGTVAVNEWRRRQWPIDLSEANLDTVDFSATNLAGANFTSAVLVDCIFAGADLRDSNFAGATLVDANLDEASVEGAVFTGADLSGVALRDTRDVAYAKFEGAVLSPVQKAIIAAAIAEAEEEIKKEG